MAKRRKVLRHCQWRTNVENSKIRWNTNQDDTHDKTIGSGVKQGCVMSPMLFLIIIDWIMKKVTDNRTGITWKLQNKLAKAQKQS
jgi:hypothetical protein